MTNFYDYKPAGFHAIVEHKGKISHLDLDSLESLLRSMAEAAGANVIGANFHDFGDGVGNTGVLLLAESHISIHTWPEEGYAAIDIFLCSGHDSMNKALIAMKESDLDGLFEVKVIERSPLK